MINNPLVARNVSIQRATFAKFFIKITQFVKTTLSFKSVRGAGSVIGEVCWYLFGIFLLNPLYDGGLQFDWSESTLAHFFLFTMLLQIQFMPSCRNKNTAVRKWSGAKQSKRKRLVRSTKSPSNHFSLISAILCSRKEESAVIMLIMLHLKERSIHQFGADLNSLSRHSWAGLNLPLAVPVCMQVESFSDLTGRWRCGQILLVGKDEHWNAF